MNPGNINVRAVGTPPLVPAIVGADHAFAIWVDDAISIWIVPPIVLVLLFTVPTNVKEDEFVLHWTEATVGTTFAVGRIELRDLIRIGVLAEIIMIVVAGTYCLIFAPYL